MAHTIINQNHFDDSLVQYGDGVFETMLAVANSLHHWRYHWSRLQHSCERLHIDVPDHDSLYADICRELAIGNNAYSVVKMLVSRGSGQRGYRSLPKQPCFVQYRISPYQLHAESYRGLRLRVCETRLAHQPLLAGMKHCNRLEYVMARRENAEGTADEGLLLDYEGNVIEGIVSNIFVLNGKTIVTPDLSHAGVAGTMRAYLLHLLPAYGYDIAVENIALKDIYSADSVFVTNATNGVLPVVSITGFDKQFDSDAVTAIRQLVGHPCCEF